MAYQATASQAGHIAEWIAQDVATSGQAASDFALVARKVADVEPHLTSAFRQHGLSLRNDGASYGKLRLQDLLRHDLTVLVFGVLRLATITHGQPGIWTDTFGVLRRVRGGWHGEAAERAISDDLSRFIADLRQWLDDNPVAIADPAQIVRRAAQVVNWEELAGLVRGQGNGFDAEVILEALGERLRAVMPRCQDWAHATAEARAEDAVTLMTIHHGTSREFHTVVVLNLDDDQWSFRRNTQESLAIVVAGLPRGAHRLILTGTAGTSDGGIRALHRALHSAGVRETRWTEGT